MDADALVRALTARFRAHDTFLPAARRNTREHFVRFHAQNLVLFEEAITAGIAVEHAASRPEAALAELRTAIAEDARVKLVGLWDDLAYSLDYVGEDEGQVYGGQPWPELCVARSGLEFLSELSSSDTRELNDYTRRVMHAHGIGLYRAVEAPEGMPERHWWWFHGGDGDQHSPLA